MTARFDKENAAIQALAKLLLDAETCRRLYEEAGILPLPRPLAVLFDQEPSRDDNASSQPLTMKIPPPKRPRPEPRGVTSEWIYVPIAEAMETSLVRAQLSPAAAHSISEIIKAVGERGRTLNKGSVANIGSRLKREGVIDYTATGWLLRENQPRIEIEGTHLWGHREVFQAQDIALYRRMAILHVLQSYAGGLQISQISEALSKWCPWFDSRIAHSQFLVKTDIGILADKKLVRKIGDSQKWALVRQREPANGPNASTAATDMEVGHSP